MRFLFSLTHLASLWERLRTSFWFLPAGMAAGAVALSYGLLRLDAAVTPEVVERLGWLYSFGPAGARAVLSAIASSMITVAGLTFSITMLTLQLASSQFGPRLLRNFMRDRGNQTVLGTFIATFVYCLLVLRTVRGVDGSDFVPHLSVAFGVGLALASIAVLIFFIHHVASSIRIETLLPELAAEARSAVDRLYPEAGDRETPDGGPEDPGGMAPRADTSFEVRAGRSGYLQRVDAEALMACACSHDLTIQVAQHPGRFLTEATVLAAAVPAERVSEDLAGRIRTAFVVGQERTPEQDLDFSLRRIVEIAQRALSPGMNDPTTALYCLDRLGEILGRLVGRPEPPAQRCDETGRPRVVQRAVPIRDLVCPPLAAVARYGKSDADVVERLLTTIDHVVAGARPETAGALHDLGAAIRRRRPGPLD